MSADSDDINGPVEKDMISTGAAAESAEFDEKLKELPRLLRYAILSDRDNEIVYERLVADIAELAPGSGIDDQPGSPTEARTSASLWPLSSTILPLSRTSLTCVVSPIASGS